MAANRATSYLISHIVLLLMCVVLFVPRVDETALDQCDAHQWN